MYLPCVRVHHVSSFFPQILSCSWAHASLLVLFLFCTYPRFSNNLGSLRYQEVLDAFSHFTYQKSNGLILVVDLQVSCSWFSVIALIDGNNRALQRRGRAAGLHPHPECDQSAPLADRLGNPSSLCLTGGVGREAQAVHDNRPRRPLRGPLDALR